MALATTINARFLDAGNKLIRSAQEGWFPASFSKRTKNAVPYLFLTLAYLVSTFPILLGMDMSSLAKMAAATTGIQAIVPNVGFLYLIKQYPEEWKKSRWYMPKFVLAIFFIISTLILVTLTYRNFKALSPALWITFAVYFIFSYIYVSIREKHVVELEE